MRRKPPANPWDSLLAGMAWGLIISAPAFLALVLWKLLSPETATW